LLPGETLLITVKDGAESAIWRNRIETLRAMVQEHAMDLKQVLWK
jgi:hypothetical protein